MGSLSIIFFAVCSLFLLLQVDVVVCKKKNHKFTEGAEVPFYVNNIGPYSNPTETYEYYSLPFCAPEVKEKKKQKMGEMLEGDRAMASLYKIPFKSNTFSISFFTVCEAFHSLCLFVQRTSKINNCVNLLLSRNRK
jgi:hypothetical protein